ncbi:PREDICTED: uncharacterized protein LOC106344359 [Brassica oleracea var. oleracea]|uniref:uncharacterized protein LOC106344359 n=1 Tax=Brassica oleracea var. oleracea TaxID=109376 RepID=UPI0006A748AB|nr:PREDICTED: uncharacterized protein LOC106344359 [Brassica oleracea var. oleracea]
MGQYSYSQPSSSSNSEDLTSLIEAEAEMYAAEAEISQWNAEVIHYEPSPEGDDGIPRTCYCGLEPVHGYSQTPKDPYRRYITCPNADDEDCHVWKWWDVAVEEEMRDIQTELSELKLKLMSEMFTHVGRSHGCIWSVAVVGRSHGCCRSHI